MAVDAADLEFRRGFLSWILRVVAAGATFVFLVMLALGSPPAEIAGVLGVAASAAIGLWLDTRLNRHGASLAISYGPLLAILLTGFFVDDYRVDSVAGGTLVALVVGGFLLGPRHVVGTAVMAIVGTAAIYTAQIVEGTQDNPRIVSAAIVVGCQVVLSLILYRYVSRGSVAEAKAKSRLAQIERLAHTADAIAAGNLGAHIDRNDPMQAHLKRMVDGLTELVLEIQRNASHLNSSAAQISATARRHRSGSAQQTSAVEETRREMERLAEQARKIAVSTATVQINAELVRSAQDEANDLHRALTGQLVRIEDVLQLIQNVARKSEMLSLNASIEGTRIGDAGRGFLQIAGEMQRLTEQIMGGVQDVKSLINDIDEISRQTVAAVANARELAHSNAELTKQIRLTTMEQEAGAGEVMEAMSSFEILTHEADSASQETLAASEELVDLAQVLNGIVARFTL